MDDGLRIHPHRWLSRCLQGACISLMLAAATTWLGASYDFPVDEAVVAGMGAPECASVRTLPAGSFLIAALPENGRCWPFFLYRASFADAPSDAASYEAWTLHQRAAEFWQLIGYVLALWWGALSIVGLSILVVRKLILRVRGSDSTARSRRSLARQRHTRGFL